MKFENFYLQKGCKDGAPPESLSVEQLGQGHVVGEGRIWGSPASTCWYLSIGVEPLGGRHQQLLVHTVECKGQDCPGLLGTKSGR